MDAERWQQISRLYHEARARAHDERRAFLDAACEGDNRLRHDVESLLDADARTEGLFTDAAADALADLVNPNDENVRRIPIPGAVLGNYRIEGLLGSGGMGVVFLAQDTTLHRPVALKVLDHRSDDETSRSRLLREACSAAALNHPNICTVYEAREANGCAFIAMEYVEGRSLRDRLDAGALLLDEAVGFGIQAADALAYAHDRDVVHRDFKAANVMITGDGRLKIVDFGLARRGGAFAATATTMASLVPSGAVAGTPYAMAPEQIRGDPADVRTDIWALGVLLYEMVAGTRPFAGATVPELFSSILRDAPRPWPDGTARTIEPVIERCLEKEAARRYQHAGEIRVALESIESGMMPPRTAQRHHLRRRVGLAAAAALAVAVALLVGVDTASLRERLLGSAVEGAPLKLAVLPLDDLSGDAEQAFFAAGTHETLITELARISALRVTARSSVLRYKGTQKRPAEIAKELNVDAVLTGSVARSGNRVRITAQLIDASTEGHLWADRYDRALGEMLTLQNEIVAAITREVRLQLTPEEQVRLARARPVNPQAYEAYLRGMFYLNQATPEGTERGLALLHEAVERDPANPLPHAHLALGYATLGHGPSPTPDAFVRARAAALRALELDEGIAQAHQVLGELTMYADRQWDWAAAERSLSRARELNPALAPSHAHYAWYVVLFDRWEEGFASMRRAQEVDPLAPLWPAWQGSLYWWVGRYDEAIRECQKSLELNPSFPTALSILGRAYSDKGMHDEAIAAQEKAVALNRSYLWGLGYAYARAGRRADALRIATEYKGTTGDGYQSATIHAALGDTEGALRALQEASERGEISPWIRNLRVFAPLRDDPRFQDLARSMKVPV